MTIHPDTCFPYRQDPTRNRTPATASTVVVHCPSVTRSRLLALLIVSMTTTLLLLVHCLRSCDLITQVCCHGNADYFAAAGHVPTVNNSRKDQVSRENRVSREFVSASGATLESAARRENSAARAGDVSREQARETGQVSREIGVSRDCLETRKRRPTQGLLLRENQAPQKSSVISQKSHISLANGIHISLEKQLEIPRKTQILIVRKKQNANQISRERHDQVSKENDDQITRENSNQTSRENQVHISRDDSNANQISREKHDKISTENQGQLSIEKPKKIWTENLKIISRENSNQSAIANNEKLSFESHHVLPKDQVLQENLVSRDVEETRGQLLRRRLPQCLIIGVRKGGTRALLEFLNLHPGIVAGKQEMHFFDRKYGLGLDWYRKRMRHSLPEQITVEKTPAYFVDERVPRRVHRMNASMKLLLTVRDPIDRAISDYLQIHSSRLGRGKFHPRFEDLAIDAATGEVNRSYKAIRRSIYHRHFERWLRFFRLEQFHFVSGENLVRDPVEELRKVERFLGIENRLDEGRFYYNKTRGFYCMVSPDLSERCLAPSKGRVHPNIDEGVIEKLRQFFRPHNKLFYKMVGVDFGWQ